MKIKEFLSDSNTKCTSTRSMHASKYLNKVKSLFTDCFFLEKKLSTDVYCTVCLELFPSPY